MLFRPGFDQETTPAHPRQTQFRPNVEIHGQAVAFVAFRDRVDKWEDSLGVAATLTEIRDYIVDIVVPSLEPFVGARE